MATDLEVAVRYTLGAVDVTKPGEALVPAGELRETISKLPDETVTLVDEGGKLVVRSANSVHTLYQMELTDFPPIGNFSEEAGTTVKTAELKDLVRKVVYAAAKENTRYAIHGIRWEISGKQICLIATDGRRLAKSWGTCEGKVKDVGAILPIRAMRLLDNVLQVPEKTTTRRSSSLRWKLSNALNWRPS
jgi:DNA polymerase-3 subunit beta